MNNISISKQRFHWLAAILVWIEGSSQDEDRAALAFTTAAVPVPAAVWLFGSGLLGLVGIARRRSKDSDGGEAMSNLFRKGAAIAPVFLFAIFLLTTSTAHSCPIDYTSGELQFGAASGNLANPIGLPSTCGLSPVSATDAAANGYSYWQGVGYGDLGVISTDYTFKIDSGWWGYSPASMGTFYIPDLIVTGGLDSTVSATVNVQFGGTASGYIPVEQNIQWAVDILDLFGNTLSSYYTGLNYAPNGSTQSAASGLLGNIPVGTPFALQMRAQWYHAGPPFNSGFTTYGYGFVQFLASEVLGLPEGYTLNSESASIENNVWVSSVPLPAAVWLFSSGLLGLAAVSRRSRYVMRAKP